MLRKFIGTVLVTMVIMITLSSIGVDIAPLLAGAGVVGLAIGFGARKLVTDIFSGFFYLVDDAFRIGEYLKSGSNSGRVEKTTLRNLFLRHHRGMLQIIPYGDLGPITNFMRGGLIEKFNLQLPYDTDIDKVRKIIKKVGQKMLQDEELGPDFIQPMKSQGVREVGDSVMTFRVKFTAKPGKQFVIRREAIKRITKALEKEGIYYAHRKVIVDLPPSATETAKQNDGTTQGTDDKSKASDKNPDPVLMAGAAAALETITKEKQEKETKK
jgi:small-conductance mechanosensitive channel